MTPVQKKRRKIQGGGRGTLGNGSVPGHCAAHPPLSPPPFVRHPLASGAHLEGRGPVGHDLEAPDAVGVGADRDGGGPVPRVEGVDRGGRSRGMGVGVGVRRRRGGAA